MAAYLARFKGSSRKHTESDLRCYLAWCAGRGLDPLAAQRPTADSEAFYASRLPVPCPPETGLILSGHVMSRRSLLRNFFFLVTSPSSC